MVTSTLALLGSDDLLGLMPEQIVSHPLGQDIVGVPLQEPGLPLSVGVYIRSGSVVSPAIRQFIAQERGLTPTAARPKRPRPKRPPQRRDGQVARLAHAPFVAAASLASSTCRLNANS